MVDQSHTYSIKLEQDYTFTEQKAFMFTKRTIKRGTHKVPEDLDNATALTILKAGAGKKIARKRSAAETKGRGQAVG